MPPRGASPAGGSGLGGLGAAAAGAARARAGRGLEGRACRRRTLADDRQQNAGDEEARGQHRRRARQEVRLAAPGEKAAAATAADAERATLGALPKHDCHKGGGDHEVNDEKNGLHEIPWLRGVAGSVSRARGASTPVRGGPLDHGRAGPYQPGAAAV